MFRIIFITIALFFIGCSRNNSSESSYSIPYLIDTLHLDYGAYCFVETPLIIKDNLIVMISNWESKEGWINCYNKKTLELNWTWNEAQEEFDVPAKGFRLGSR